MSPTGRSAVARLYGLWRALVVLLACLGLAGVSLAAASGSRTDPAAAVLDAARDQLGDAYVWGGTGPDAWDCSGFTSRLWKSYGGVTDIPRTSRQQQAWAVPIPIEQAEPGDLFFAGEPVSHVALVETVVRTKAGTTVILLDASSSKKGVVRRAAWKSGVIRYGRVPRPGMTRVTPWTPPVVAAAKPAPAKSTPVKTVATSNTPATSAPAKSTSPTAPAKAAAPAPKGKGLVTGLPATSRPGSATAQRAAALARAALDNTTLSDVELIRNVWRRAGGAVLPTSRSGLSSATVRVPLSDARVGDLIVYAAPAAHVGIYVGDGFMVDASRSLGKVVLRKVWAADGVQVRRLAA